MSLTSPLEAIPVSLSANPDRSVRLVPWREERFSQWGHDPRSAYAERFWLPVLGPAALLLARNTAYGFDGAPDGYDIGIDVQGRLIGISSRVVFRTLSRLQQFGLVTITSPTEVAVRTHWRDVWPAVLDSMPYGMRAAHGAYIAVDPMEANARRWWALTVWMHSVRRGGAQVDAVLRSEGCPEAFRVELVNWVAATDRFEIGSRKRSTDMGSNRDGVAGM